MTDVNGDNSNSGFEDSPQVRQPAVPDGDDRPVATPWFRGPWTLKAVGAAALAGIIVGYALYSAVRPVETNRDDATRRGTGQIALVKPGTGAPFDRTFAWERVDTATEYRVLVFTSGRDRVFELRDLTTPSVTIDESVKLAPGRYFWQVIAYRGADELSESPLTEFVVP